MVVGSGTRTSISTPSPGFERTVTSPPVLRARAPSLADLEAVQDRREPPTRFMQRLQLTIQRALIAPTLARAGVAAKLRADGERSATVTVTVTSVPAQTWFAWLEEVCRESRVRIVRARVTRAAAAGTVDAEAGLELPAR